jgi:hypothetical protein
LSPFPSSPSHAFHGFLYLDGFHSSLWASSSYIMEQKGLEHHLPKFVALRDTWWQSVSVHIILINETSDILCGDSVLYINILNP